MDPNIVSTGKDGALHGMTEAEVDALVGRVRSFGKIVVHIHGGLVPEAAGLEIAGRLTPEYANAGAASVFFVWRSGLWETLRNDYALILKESLFKSLRRKLLSWVVGDLTTPAGAKALGGARPAKDPEVNQELAKAAAGGEPFAGLSLAGPPREPSGADEAKVAKDVQDDPAFKAAVQAILVGLLANEPGAPAKNVAPPGAPAEATLLSPELQKELKDDALAAKGKGLFDPVKLAAKAGKAFFRVIRRFVRKTDHGVYPTVVEEILREFYLANAGAALWTALKERTRSMFQPGRGGALFFQRLADACAGGPLPEITLVGHSTGAVFIGHLLDFAAELNARAGRRALAFKNLVFLAPACRVDFFDALLAARAGLFERFRMFTMTDANESRDALVPGLYTRSLLYLISGLLEDEGEGEDVAVLGMERYFADPGVYASPEVSRVREFLNGEPGRAVWSVAAGGAGLNSASLRHGDFDNDAGTIESVRHVISG